FFSSRRRHTIFSRDWSSDVCSSDLFRLSGAFEAPSSATSNDAALHAALADGADHLAPAFVQIHLTTDQRHLFGAQRRELSHHVQRFRKGKLVGSCGSCARATVTAPE